MMNVDRTTRAAYFRLLSRLADRLPDDLLGHALGWAAAGRYVDVVEAVAFAATTVGFGVSEPDRALLRAGLAAWDRDVGILHGIDDGTDGVGWWAFAPVSPAVLNEHGDRLPYCMDLTESSYDGPGGLDDLDRSLAKAADGVPGLAGLWRAWRYPASKSPWPAPRRQYLAYVESGGRAEFVEAAAQLVDVVIANAEHANREPLPFVDVIGDTAELTTYQRAMLSASALTWARRPDEGLRFIEAIAGNVAPDRSLTSAERSVVLDYLERGQRLVTAEQPGTDELDPSNGDVVPGGWRTDGRWVWPEAVAYYLRVHAVAPDEAFLKEIRHDDRRDPVVGPVQVHRALSALYARPWPQ
jgi:hypothetical protein